MTLLDDCSVAILAGGKSSRFGKDKGLANFNGKPLIQHVISIAKIISNRVYIIANNTDYHKLKISVLNDEFKYIGPLGGLHAALKNCSTSHCFLLACDMPFIQTELLYGLYEMRSHQAVVPVHQNRPEPLCALYHSSALSVIEKQIEAGKFKMTDAIGQLDHHWYQVDENAEFYNSKMFANINTLSDLKNYQ